MRRSSMKLELVGKISVNLKSEIDTSLDGYATAQNWMWKIITSARSHQKSLLRTESGSNSMRSNLNLLNDVR